MKGLKRRIATVLVAALMMTLFATVGVSAAAPNPVRTFNVYSFKNGVWLEWSPYDNDFDEYQLDVYTNVKQAPRWSGRLSKSTTSMWFPISYAAYFRIRTVKNGVLSNMYTKPCAPIREMKYYIKVKGRGNMKATKFSGGNYIVESGGGRSYIPYSRVGSASAEFTRFYNYSREDAERYVNAMKYASKTSNLIWISTYTQHVYLFTGSRGNWKCYYDWECATGRADAPTPTGMNGRKDIWKKVRTRNGLPYWSCFSSMNAFHGRENGWPVGAPASGGCVRNPNEYASVIYNKTAMNTSVLVY